MTFKIGNKYGLKNKGRIHSEETRRKISLGKKGKIVSEEHKRKIRISLKKAHAEGKFKNRFNTETRRKMSLSQKKRFKNNPPWSKGKKGICSEETRRKISEGNKGKISWIKGKKHSEESRKRMSTSHIGKPGHPQSEETKKKISISHIGKIGTNLGKIFSQEHKNKMRLSRAKQIMPKGENHPLWGKHQSEISKRKISASHQGITLDKWKNFISFEPYSIDWTRTLKRAIRERDRYTCQICRGEGLIVHHIDYNKKNCDSTNLIILCKKCHSKTNSNREKWKEYFSKCKLKN